MKKQETCSTLDSCCSTYYFMHPRRIFAFSGLYGLFLGMGITTGQVTAEIVIKGFLIVFPPIALVYFFRDMEYRRKQNFVFREMREAQAIANGIIAYYKERVNASKFTI